MKTVSERQYFMAIHDVEKEKLGCLGPCRDYTLPRYYDLSRPKGRIRGNTRTGPALEVTVTYHQGLYGIEIRIGSMQNEGSQSWVVIRRGMNTHVTEMPKGSEKFPDNVEANATNSTPAQHQASSSSMNATLPFGQRHRITIPVANRADWDYDSSAYWLPKTVCRILRHKDQLREADGAVEWGKLCLE